MQDNLKRLFDEISMPVELLSYFNNASIDKVITYDSGKMLEFIFNTEEVLPIDVYNNVLHSLIGYFNTVKNIKL
ncbi:MAG: hypothetical protein IKI04_01890, partial [Bacilli bacterium]|nr:hypothetical protein [Bacilli bacterium]